MQFFKSIKPLKLGVKKGEFCSIVFLTGIAIGLLAFFGSCSRNPNSGTVVRVGIATWPGFASGMVGQKKGFFGDIDVQSRVIDDIPARHAAFQSGDIDIMVSSVDQSVHEYAGGLKGKIILVTDESAGGDGIVANPDIKTAADLRGKKIAFAQTTPSHYLLFKVLEKAGMSPDDVEQVKVDDPGNAGQAFLGGKVDAAVTWEPLLTQVRESTKGHLLASTKEFPETVVDILIASPKLLAKPEVLKRFISGWLKSVDDIKEHPQEDSKIIAKGLGMKLEDAAGTMAGLQFADAKKNGYFFSPNPAECPLSKVFRDAGGFWKRQKLIQNVPAAEEVIEPSILQMLPASPAPGN